MIVFTLSKCPHFGGIKFKSVLTLLAIQVHTHIHTETHRHKPIRQLSGLLVPHDKGNRSEKFLFQLPVCLYHPPPSILCSCTSSSIRCLYASLSADKSFIPRRPGTLQLCTLLQAPVCMGTVHHELHPHDLVLTLRWMAGCFDSAVSLITSPSTFCMNCFPDNDHKGLRTPDANK